MNYYGDKKYTYIANGGIIHEMVIQNDYIYITKKNSFGTLISKTKTKNVKTKLVDDFIQKSINKHKQYEINKLVQSLEVNLKDSGLSQVVNVRKEYIEFIIKLLKGEVK